MELEKEEAKTTTMRCFITSKGLKKSEVYRFFFAACMLSVTTVAVGLYLSAASQDLLTPRQLLREEPPNLRTVTKSEITIDSDNPVVKLELVSFRSLQPDGSLEIKHIYVETKVHVVDRSPPTAVAAMKTRQSLRPSRRLVEVSESNDEHDNEELAADKKTHPTPFQTSGSFFFVGTEEVDESINDDETPVFYRKTHPTPLKTIDSRRRLVGMIKDGDHHNDDEGLAYYQKTLTKPVIPSAFHRRVDDPEDESTVRRRKLLEKVASEASTASAGTTDSFTSEFGVLPAILVAIASAMLACSALLFFYFLRDRRCFEKLLLRHCENTTGTSEKQNVKGEGSGASDSHTGTERTEGSALTEKSSSSKQNETGGQEVFDVFPSKVPSSKHCWGGSREAPEIIFIHSSAPPAMVEKSEDKIEDAMHGTTRTQSLQPTLTVSESDGIFEDRLLLSSKPVRSGSDYYYERNPTTFKMTTTLLLGKDRVNDYSDLGSLILNLTTTRIASTSTRCGSSKGGSNSSGTKLRATPYSDYETQCGEVFVNSCYEDMIHISASSNAPKLEARDDQTYNLRGTAVDNDIRMDIERYAFNPYDNTATSELLIRDIYCTPAAIWGQGTMKFADFGLELKNSLCPHPFIVAVNKCSPLSGRTCNGDVLISVNDMDTAGLSPKDVFDLVPLTASGAIKFTVLRTFETDSEDCESLHGPSCRVDLGLVEPAVDI